MKKLKNRQISSNHFSVILLSLALAMSALPLYNAAHADTLATSVAVGSNPSEIAVNSATNTIYVGDYNTVSVINGATNALTATIALETTSVLAAYGQGNGLVVNPSTNRIYVGSINSTSYPSTTGKISVIDGSTNQIMDSIKIPAPGILALSVNPATNMIYALVGLNMIEVINGATDQVTGSAISLNNTFWGPNPSMDVNPVTNTLYVAGIQDLGGLHTQLYVGKVAVVNAETNSLARLIETSRPAYPIKVGIAVNTVTDTIYTTNGPGAGIAVINGTSNTVTNTIALPSTLQSIAVNAVTDKVYSTGENSNSLYILDGSKGSVSQTLGVGSTSIFVALNPKSNKVYVANFASDTVSVINGAVGTVSTYHLSVGTQDQNGNPISGYPLTLSFQNGSLGAAGSSPDTFVLNGGEQYTIRADDSGSCSFTSWSTGSTNRVQSVSISADAQITAIYACGPGPAPLGSWTFSTSYPNSGGPSCVIAGSFIYCVGGAGILNAVYFTSISSSSGIGPWMPTTSYPVGVALSSCVTSDGYIFCVGGQVAIGDTSAVYYAPVSSSGVGTWTPTTSYPFPVGYSSCTVSGGYIYCVGGLIAGSIIPTDAVYYAPISSSGIGQWTSTTSYPISLNFESCVTVGGYIYCINGIATPRNYVYYAPISSAGALGAWTGTTKYPAGAYYVWSEPCVVIGGLIYCIGALPTSYYSQISSSGTLGTWMSTSSSPNLGGLQPQSCATAAGYIYCVGETAVAYTSIGSSSTQTSKLTVNSQSPGGQTITGYYTALYDQSGNIVASGFTPSTFALSNGQTYTVQVDDYGSCHFDHWSDTGRTSASRSMSITSNTQITAVYNCGGGETSSSVTVNSVDQKGGAIFGYYTALWQKGNSIATGFTTKTFSTTSGQTYSVEADSYGSCTFTNWSDGGIDNPRTFTATGSALAFTAVYICGSSTTSTINVSTVNSAGNQITGYYITVWQNGVLLQSCFSPCAFTVNNGQMYQVAAASYGSETFNHWANDGSTGFETMNVPSTSTTISLTAVYNP